MEATVVSDFEEVWQAGPGAVLILLGPAGAVGRRSVVLACPGCGDVASMRVYLPGEAKPPSPSWLLEGVGGALTMHPSINCVGCCGRHGWLSDCVFRKC